MQTVTQIQDKHLVIQRDPDRITNIFVHFYHTLLGEGGGNRTIAHENWLKNDHTLTTKEQLILLQEYTGKEVKEAIFSIYVNKSPEPDGYGCNFYRDA